MPGIAACKQQGQPWSTLKPEQRAGQQERLHSSPTAARILPTGQSSRVRRRGLGQGPRSCIPKSGGFLTLGGVMLAPRPRNEHALSSLPGQVSAFEWLLCRQYVDDCQ